MAHVGCTMTLSPNTTPTSPPTPTLPRQKQRVTLVLLRLSQVSCWWHMTKLTALNIKHTVYASTHHLSLHENRSTKILLCVNKRNKIHTTVKQTKYTPNIVIYSPTPLCDFVEIAVSTIETSDLRTTLTSVLSHTTLIRALTRNI
eukprot:m.45434 g.45434  ORF g.45434 m.45434 type:complete len:145 (+) comp19966_c0_seq1:1320-1754(+)